MITVLMISAKMVTLAFLEFKKGKYFGKVGKEKLFWNKGYGIKMFPHEVTNKILSLTQIIF